MENNKWWIKALENLFEEKDSRPSLDDLTEFIDGIEKQAFQDGQNTQFTKKEEAKNTEPIEYYQDGEAGDMMERRKQ